MQDSDAEHMTPTESERLEIDATNIQSLRDCRPLNSSQGTGSSSIAAQTSICAQLAQTSICAQLTQTKVYATSASASFSSSVFGY